MNEWTVVSVIVVLTGLIISVAKPLISLNATLTRLTDAISVLQEELKNQSEKNSAAHSRLWDKEREQDKRLCDHEFRIKKIEGG